MKAASVQQKAASAVTSVDTLNIKRTMGIVFVPHIDVHIK